MKLQVRQKSLSVCLSFLNNKKGYTLSEIIIILIFLSVLLLGMAPLSHRTFLTIQSNHVIDQFKSDVLVAQTLTMNNHPNFYLLFRTQLNDYVLYDGKEDKTIYERKLPDNWSFQMQTIQSPIIFNRNGTIRNPGTMRIYSPLYTYKITFPFGASRVSIEKQ